MHGRAYVEFWMHACAIEMDLANFPAMYKYIFLSSINNTPIEQCMLSNSHAPICNIVPKYVWHVSVILQHNMSD